jgi:hypothetical protein
VPEEARNGSGGAKYDERVQRVLGKRERGSERECRWELIRRAPRMRGAVRTKTISAMASIVRIRRGSRSCAPCARRRSPPPRPRARSDPAAQDVDCRRRTRQAKGRQEKSRRAQQVSRQLPKGLAPRVHFMSHAGHQCAGEAVQARAASTLAAESPMQARPPRTRCAGRE